MNTLQASFIWVLMDLHPNPTSLEPEDGNVVMKDMRRGVCYVPQVQWLCQQQMRCNRWKRVWNKDHLLSYCTPPKNVKAHLFKIWKLVLVCCSIINSHHWWLFFLLCYKLSENHLPAAANLSVFILLQMLPLYLELIQDIPELPTPSSSSSQQTEKKISTLTPLIRIQENPVDSSSVSLQRNLIHNKLQTKQQKHTLPLLFTSLSLEVHSGATEWNLLFSEEQRNF